MHVVVRDNVLRAMYTPMVGAQFAIYYERLMRLYDYFNTRRNAVKKHAARTTRPDKRYHLVHTLANHIGLTLVLSRKSLACAGLKRRMKRLQEEMKKHKEEKKNLDEEWKKQVDERKKK